MRLALLDPRTGEPAIKLAIEGLQSDGWYDLAPIEVRTDRSSLSTNRSARSQEEEINDFH
jgi:hypothetical protein